MPKINKDEITDILLTLTTKANELIEERDRLTAETQPARWRILGEAAKAMCDACRTGVKVIMLDDQIFHDVPNGIDGCDAEPIQLMIFTEMIAAQEAAHDVA